MQMRQPGHTALSSSWILVRKAKFFDCLFHLWLTSLPEIHKAAYSLTSVLVSRITHLFNQEWDGLADLGAESGSILEGDTADEMSDTGEGLGVEGIVGGTETDTDGFEEGMYCF